MHHRPLPMAMLRMDDGRMAMDSWPISQRTMVMVPGSSTGIVQDRAHPLPLMVARAKARKAKPPMVAALLQFAVAREVASLPRAMAIFNRGLFSSSRQRWSKAMEAPMDLHSCHDPRGKQVDSGPTDDFVERKPAGRGRDHSSRKLSSWMPTISWRMPPQWILQELQ